MARSRNIKPSIMDNEELANLDALSRLLFIYLWMLADKAGRLEDRPKRIAARALPYDRSADIESMLNGLQKAGFIVRYESNGIACIQIVSFSKHQNPHVRESESELPAQDTSKAETKHNLGDTKTQPRSPDSGFLIPDSGFSDSVPPATPKESIAELFNEFYKSYPKKKAPDDALKAFTKRKPDRSMVDQMLKAIAEQCKSDDWLKNKGQFIPYPATWLNTGSWKDEGVDLPDPEEEARKRRDEEIEEERRIHREHLAKSVRPPQNISALLAGALSGKVHKDGVTT